MGVELYYFLAFLVAVAVAIGVAVRRARRAELPAPPKKKELPPAAEVKPGREPEAEAPPRERAKPEAAPPRTEVTTAPLEVTAPQEKPTVAREPAVVRVARDTAQLKAGLQRTRSGFIARIGALFQGKKQIDPATFDRLEEVLLTADIGVKTSGKIFEALKRDLDKEQLTDPEAIWSHIRGQSAAVLDVGAGELDLDRARPLVIITIGVNGVGKTTTIGKLASKYVRLGKKVLLAAGDTFRAAATEQLEIWGQRTGCPVVKGKEGADPSSVIFEAVKKAQADGYDVLIADTAGRLHTKTNLMEELQKVRRVTGKAMEGAPHETFLVLDSTTGQNAIAQAQMFKEAMAITGIVITKLDGTAKGGVILGICDELKVPVRYIGIGEKVDDLREFDANEFVAALYDRADDTAAA